MVLVEPYLKKKYIMKRKVIDPIPILARKLAPFLLFLFYS